MKQKNTIKHSWVFILFLSLSASAQNLSFADALMLMTNGNQKLKAVEKQIEVAKLGAESASGLRYPTLSLNGSYIMMNEDLYLNLNEYKYPASGLLGVEPNMLGDWNFKFQEQNIGRLSADFKWPIYTGGKIKAAIRAEQLNVELASVEANKTKNILISELAQRYFQTQLAKEATVVREQALDAANQHLYNAQKLEENGIIAPVETMQAQTAIADAQRELMAVQKDEYLARTALYGVMGISENQDNLSTPLFNVQKLKPLDEYQNIAKRNYPEIVQAHIKKQMALQNVAVQKGNFIPDVALIGKKYLLQDNLPLTEPNWFIGIGFQVNVFNGFQNKKDYEQAIVMGESVDLFTAQAERDIQTLVKKYYTEILKQQQQIQSLEESISFSEELVRVRQKAFTEGFATTTDVADANLYLASIKIKRLQAMLEIDINLAKLLETCGISETFLDYAL